MLATQSGHLAIVELLIAAKAHVNAQNYIGTTSLHVAVAMGQTEMVSVLLKNGADPNIMDKVNTALQRNHAYFIIIIQMGTTAMVTAKMCDHILIYQMLLVYQVASVLFC